MKKLLILFLFISNIFIAQTIKTYIYDSGTRSTTWKIGKDGGGFKWDNDSSVFKVMWNDSLNILFRDSSWLVMVDNGGGNNIPQLINGRKRFVRYVQIDTMRNYGGSTYSFGHFIPYSLKIPPEVSEAHTGEDWLISAGESLDKLLLFGRGFGTGPGLTLWDTLASRRWVRTQTFEPIITTLSIAKGGTNTNWFTDGKFIKYNGTKLISTTYDSLSFEPALTKGNLTETVTGLQFDNTRQVIGGAAVLSLSSGYIIPTTTEQTNWTTAYTNRITSLTTTGSSGASTLISNVLNIPHYTLAGLGGISLSSLSAVAPLSYNSGTGAFSLKYSALNLRNLNDSLNTIQNIAVTSSPTFAGLTAINGNSNTQSIYPLLTDTYDLGSWTKYWSNGYLSQIQATIFAENTISAVGGYMFITKGQGLLPAVSTAPTPIDFGQTMTPNDFVLIKAKDTGGIYKTEYIQVLTLVSGTTYNVTRDVASAHVTDPAWADGTVYVVLGNTGNGRLELNAYDTPRLSIIKQGATYNSQTELIRLGDLNGFLGYSSETYGIAIGEATKYLKYDATNGLVIAGNVTATTGAIGGWTLGANSLTSTNIGLHSGASAQILLGHATDYATAKIGLKNDGSGKIASGNFSWDISGNVTASGTWTNSATITGGTIQTAASGKRVKLSSSDNYLAFYDMVDGYGAAQEVATINSSGADQPGLQILVDETFYLGGYDITLSGTNIALIGSNSIALNNNFIVNASGQITKINNVVTSGFVPISNGTHYEPRALTKSDVGLSSVTNNAQIYSLNSLTAQTQTFAIGTSGTAPAFSSATSTHTLNIPMASTSSVTAGLISKTDYDTFNGKTTLANVLATANTFTAEQSFNKFKLNAEVSHSVTGTGNYDCTDKNVIILTPTNNGYTASLTNLSINRPVMVINGSGTYTVTVNSTSGGKLLAVYGCTWVMYNATTGFTYVL